MILQRQNCAIFYDEDPTLIDDEEMYFSDLRQMQLIVIVVTSNFLYRENIAFNKVFRFAMENHIPVLPIMEERGLESEFNRICGDLQFLDPNATDLTAISFEEKLSKYLSSVLVGDEMAAKVRAAFDAYVFLSYRKKDRKYAQELMRLIHKNEFCRDIAIWYDEFLVPGENFNESIKTALDKSELFALVVTPNLVNEENYVMTTEYPMAKKADKRILPAELLPTDTEILKTNFPQIPECTDPNDEKALAETLLKSLEHVAKMENDNDPQHNFFIGLAYLSGIDVEVDHERAVELITSSANAGLPEAIEKIVTMYRSGEGVVRNYEMALEWQRRLVRLYKESYAENQTEHNGLLLLQQMVVLSDYLYELGNNREAKSVCEKINSNGIISHKHISVDGFKRYVAVSYNRIGYICEEEGNLELAIQYYEKSLEIIIKLFEKNIVTEADLKVCYNTLGDVYEKQRDLMKALSYYKKSMAIAVKIEEETGTVESRCNLAGVYVRFGDIYARWGFFDEALRYYQKTLNIRISLAQEIDETSLKRDLAVIYHRFGNLYEEKEDYEQALCYYEKSLDIFITLAELTNTIEAKLDLSSNYNSLGSTYTGLGNFEEAILYCEKSIEIAIELFEEAGTVEIRDNLALSYYNMAFSIMISSEDIDDQLYFRQAYNIWNELTKHCPDMDEFYNKKMKAAKYLKWFYRED